ncbi:hypothetical protein GCM10017767_14950 [Halomonas urumqiensis]|nr:hypothetical protein GCM10017767_14950 [Halomonas urumqiensis]
MHVANIPVHISSFDGLSSEWAAPYIPADGINIHRHLELVALAATSFYQETVSGETHGQRPPDTVG